MFDHCSASASMVTEHDRESVRQFHLECELVLAYCGIKCLSYCKWMNEITLSLNSCHVYPLPCSICTYVPFYSKWLLVWGSFPIGGKWHIIWNSWMGNAPISIHGDYVYRLLWIGAGASTLSLCNCSLILLYRAPSTAVSVTSCRVMKE